MGLLEPNLSAACYWPGMFAQNGKLQLLKGKLETELLIDF